MPFEPEGHLFNLFDKKQIKTPLPKHEYVHRGGGGIVPGYDQDLETLENLENEPQLDIYLHADDEKDFAIQLKDGTVTRARTAQINGIRWFIPIQEHIKVPESVYKLVMGLNNKPSMPPTRFRTPMPNETHMYLGNMTR